MILVTGATGTVGREVVKQLLEAGEEVRVLARDPAKAEKLGPGVEVAQGDLAKPDTLGSAFAGVDKAFVLATGPELTTLESNAYDAAKKAGVRHIVKVSAQGAELDKDLLIGRWHRDSEEKLKASGIAWTILRPGGFASNALMWAGSIKATGMVFQPTGNAKTAPIDPRDIAAVAVKALTSPGHEGKAYELSGPEAMTTDEMVQRLGAAIGKPLRFVDVPESAARDRMAQSGMPEIMINAVLELMAHVRTGGGATVSSTVEQVLGRKARKFDEWARDHAAAFVQAP